MVYRPRPCRFTPPGRLGSRLYLRSFARRFCLCQERMRFPEKGKTYSINEGNSLSFRTGEEVH
ncbi:hypothetical protein ACLK1T_08800 [Escherichia coli]